MSSHQRLPIDLPMVETTALDSNSHTNSKIELTKHIHQVFELEHVTEDSSCLDVIETFELDSHFPTSAVDNTQIEMYFPDPKTPLELEQIEFESMPKQAFTISIEDTKQQIEFYNNSSLLEAMETQGVQMPYQCREGYCGACRTKLIKGEVAYLQEPIAWLNDNEVLPCCCIPINDIEIKL